MALLPVMSVAELQESVLALPQRERHEFVVWINRLEAGHGDVPGEALDQLAAEIRDEDDRITSARCASSCRTLQP